MLHPIGEQQLKLPILKGKNDQGSCVPITLPSTVGKSFKTDFERENNERQESKKNMG